MPIEYRGSSLQMHTANLLPQKMVYFLILGIACSVPTQALRGSSKEKDKAAPQEKKTDEKKPNNAVGGGIEILSDTMGVDFGPYMQRLKVQVQSHWNPLIPESVLPPMMKTGTVVIE